MFHFYRTPSLLRLLFKDIHWSIPTAGKEIYLTFDDGPIPGLTEYVLDQLQSYDAKATFFCVGDNIRKYPQIFRKVIDGGHRVGNHTFNHWRAWQHSEKIYLENVSKCQGIINNEIGEQNSPLFRPPYGQITKKLIHALKEKYEIIMWDVLAYDFSDKHKKEKSLKKAIASAGPGSIVVFHDNYKAEHKLKHMLPGFLNYFSDLGYRFKKLPII